MVDVSVHIAALHDVTTSCTYVHVSACSCRADDVITFTRHCKITGKINLMTRLLTVLLTNVAHKELRHNDVTQWRRKKARLYLHTTYRYGAQGAES